MRWRGGGVINGKPLSGGLDANNLSLLIFYHEPPGENYLYAPKDSHHNLKAILIKVINGNKLYYYYIISLYVHNI